MAAQGPMVIAAGGRIVEILGAKGGGPTSRADLDAWIGSHHLTIPTVMDAPGMDGASLKALERREIAYLVDLSTMKILRRYLGSVFGTGESAAKTAMAELLALVGNKGG